MPLYSVTTTERGTTVGVWKVEETEEQLLELYPDMAAPLRQEVDSRFTAPGRRLEFIAVRILFRSLLQRRLPIGYHPSGRPYALDGSLQISISHTLRRTARYVAVIYHPERTVGIDIEAIAPQVERIRDRFLSSTETAEGLEQLLLCWSGKETVFKVMDKEGVDFREHLYVVPFTYTAAQPQGIFTIQEKSLPEKQDYEVNYRVESDFVLTWTE